MICSLRIRNKRAGHAIVPPPISTSTVSTSTVSTATISTATVSATAFRVFAPSSRQSGRNDFYISAVELRTPEHLVPPRKQLHSGHRNNRCRLRWSGGRRYGRELRIPRLQAYSRRTYSGRVVRGRVYRQCRVYRLVG